MPQDSFRFRCSIRVRWSDCDAQGIAFNATYLTFLEIAQAAYFRNLGIALYDPQGRRYFDTATVKATLEYLLPARVDSVIDVHWRIQRIGNTSFTTLAEIYDRASATLLTRAEIVYVNFDSENAVSRPILADMRRLIETYEATGSIIPIDDLHELSGVARASDKDG